MVPLSSDSKTLALKCSSLRVQIKSPRLPSSPECGAETFFFFFYWKFCCCLGLCALGGDQTFPPDSSSSSLWQANVGVLPRLLIAPRPLLPFVPVGCPCCEVCPCWWGVSRGAVSPPGPAMSPWPSSLPWPRPPMRPHVPKPPELLLAPLFCSSHPFLNLPRPPPHISPLSHHSRNKPQHLGEKQCHQILI